MKKLPNSQIVNLSFIPGQKRIDRNDVYIYCEPGKVGTQRVALHDNNLSTMLVLGKDIDRGFILNVEQVSTGIIKYKAKETTAVFTSDANRLSDNFTLGNAIRENSGLRDLGLKKRRVIREALAEFGFKNKPKTTEQMMNGLKFFHMEKDYL